MCLPNPKGGFHDVGTMLEILEVKYTNQGTILLDCIGTRRFRVKSRGKLVWFLPFLLFQTFMLTPDFLFRMITTLETSNTSTMRKATNTTKPKR